MGEGFVAYIGIFAFPLYSKFIDIVIMQEETATGVLDLPRTQIHMTPPPFK